jgi:arylsulfatase A-like enzyme
MTDQQRVVQFFPDDWVEANLPNLNKLKSTGITFNNGTTNSCRCSPVRGMLWTGLYPPRSGITSIGPQSTLSTTLPTLGKILGPAYSGNMAFKGKWHLDESFTDASETRPNDPTVLAGQNKTMATNYGMTGWDAPDAGTALGWTPTNPPFTKSNINTLGGGPMSPAMNDARITADACEFLKTNVTSGSPFFLVTSLVNPHDIWADMFSTLMTDAFPEYPRAMDSLPFSSQFTTSILPASYQKDDLTTKPSIQTVIRNTYTTTYADNNGISPVPTMLDPDDALNYLKFYAYLNYLSDRKLAEIYSYLSTNNMLDNTIIVRIADHGEMGMSHGGLMEKDCNFYRETTNVPIIFSNPVLWPTAVESDALMGLVDIMPTLMSIAGVTFNADNFQGNDFSQYLLQPSGTPPQDALLFTYDDDYPFHIRAVRTAPGTISVNGDTSPYKYAVYYEYKQITQNGNTVYELDASSVQYELYNVDNDVEELNNLLPVGGTADSHSIAVQQALHPILTQLMSNVDQKGPGGPVQPSPPTQNPSDQVGPAVTPYGWSGIKVV